MKTPLDKQVYAGLMEIIKDKKYYYQSAASPEYNKLTEEGSEAIIEFIRIMAAHMIKYDNQMLDARSKQMMMDVLKS
jgi:hypothetical protein